MVFSKRISIIILGLFLLITGIQVSFVPGVKFNYDFDHFFPAKHQETRFFEDFKAKYGSDNDFLIIAFESENGVFNTPFLSKIDTLTRFLESHPYIANVMSPTNSIRTIRDPLSGALFKRNLISISDTADYNFDSTFIYKNQEVFRALFGENKNSIRIIAQHLERLEENQSSVLLDDIHSFCSKFNLYPIMGGRVVAHNYYVEMSQNELILFIGSSVGLIVIFLVLSFRSVIGVVVPALIVAGSVLWVIGLMGQMGKDLNIVLNVLPTIMMVVGISGVVHLFAHYFDEIRNGYSKIDALKKGFYDVRRALIFTNLTTMIGFLTLTTSSITPIIEFGYFAAIGVFFSFILSMTVMPAMLVLFRAPKIAHNVERKNSWEAPLGRFYDKLIASRGKTIVVFSLLLIASSIGVFLIRANNYIIEDLKDDHPMKVDYRYLEDNFNGARPLNFEVSLKDTSLSFFNKDVLNELDMALTKMEEIYESSALISPVYVIKNAYMTQKAGNPYYFSIPNSTKDIVKIQREFDRFVSDSLKYALFSRDMKSARITGTMGDVGAYISGEMNEEWDNWRLNETNLNYLEFHQTGGPYLMEINNQLLTSNILQGLIIAIFIIALIIGGLFRSFRIVLISLVPNILPLLMIGAIMGYFGIDMKVSTSLLFTIAFGIAVDDTIHFLSKYKMLLEKGLQAKDALRETYISTGKAIIITSIVLSGGFLTLTFSSFLGTFYIGLLTGLTMVFAVITDLTLLPVLLHYFTTNEKKKISN